MQRLPPNIQKLLKEQYPESDESETSNDGNFRFHGITGRIVMIKRMPDGTINMDCFQERLKREGKI